jgi:hypothetical protein
MKQMEPDKPEDSPIEEDNPFAKYAGILPAFPAGIKEINAWVRSLRDDFEGPTDDESV